jgi:hypothetical protein
MKLSGSWDVANYAIDSAIFIIEVLAVFSGSLAFITMQKLWLAIKLIIADEIYTLWYTPIHSAVMFTIVLHFRRVVINKVVFATHSCYINFGNTVSYYQTGIAAALSWIQLSWKLE